MSKFLGENGVQELVSLIKDTDLRKIKESFTSSYIIDRLSYWFDTSNCDVVPTRAEVMDVWFIYSVYGSCRIRFSWPSSISAGPEGEKLVDKWYVRTTDGEGEIIVQGYQEDAALCYFDLVVPFDEIPGSEPEEGVSYEFESTPTKFIISENPAQIKPTAMKVEWKLSSGIYVPTVTFTPSNATSDIIYTNCTWIPTSSSDHNAVILNPDGSFRFTPSYSGTSTTEVTPAGSVHIAVIPLANPSIAEMMKIDFNNSGEETGEEEEDDEGDDTEDEEEG